ncbi:unnamed protein product [Mucor hiemalis]
MGTTKSRKFRRNNSRPTAFTFLSNIALGSENEKPPDESIQRLSAYLTSNTNNNDQQVHYVEESSLQIGASSLHSSDSSFSAEEDSGGQTSTAAVSGGTTHTTTAPPVITLNNNGLNDPFLNTNNTNNTRRGRYLPPKRNPSESSNDSGDVQHHKLTREDSERPIASEKIKKKSNHGDKEHGQSSMSIMSVFRYYTDKIRHSTSRKKSSDLSTNRGYVQQQLESHDNHRRRKAQSYAHFLNTTGSLLDDSTLEEHLTSSSYDPYFLDDDTYGKYGLDPNSLGTLANGMKPSDLKREMNEQFRLNHPDIPVEITLSKIRAIKLHLLEIGRAVDIEVSSVAHAYVYFEKLVIKV